MNRLKEFARNIPAVRKIRDDREHSERKIEEVLETQKAVEMAVRENCHWATRNHVSEKVRILFGGQDAATD